MVKKELQLERYPLNEGLQLFINIVIFRAFLSFQTTLSSESPFMKVLYLWISFQGNLNHLIWISVEEVMAKIRKLLKAKKLQCFGETWLERVGTLWTSRHTWSLSRVVPNVTSWYNINSTFFYFSSSILHSNKSKVLLMHQLNLETCINYKTKHKRHLEIKTSIT